jgi:hypothetical protein
MCGTWWQIVHERLICQLSVLKEREKIKNKIKQKIRKKLHVIILSYLGPKKTPSVLL